jgi:spermidine synthase
MLVTWGYNPATFGAHRTAYMETVRSAGFTEHLAYPAYDDLDADSEVERGEQFYIFTTGARPNPSFNDSESAYVKKFAHRYEKYNWEKVPEYRGASPNSIFNPNYDIIVSY